MTECVAVLNAKVDKKKRKNRKRKLRNSKKRKQTSECRHDSFSSDGPLSPDLEMTLLESEHEISHGLEKGKEQDERHDALASDSDEPRHHLIKNEHSDGEAGVSVYEIAKELKSPSEREILTGSIKKISKYIDVDADSLNVSGLRTYKRKKHTRVSRRKRKKRSNSIPSGLESIKVGAGSSGNDTSLNNLDETLESGFSMKTLGDINVDNSVQLSVGGSLSPDLEIMLLESEHGISRGLEKEKEQNERHDALASDGGSDNSRHHLIKTEHTDGTAGVSVYKLAKEFRSPAERDILTSSIKKSNKYVDVDADSLNVSGLITYKRKNLNHVYLRKGKQCSNSKSSGLESIKEGAGRSGNDISLNNLDETLESGFSMKTVGQGLVGLGSNLQVSKCSNVQVASGEIEMEIEGKSLKDIMKYACFLNDVSMADLPENLGQGNSDNPDSMGNEVQDRVGSEGNIDKSILVYEGKVSDHASGNASHNQNVDSNSLVIQPKVSHAKELGELVDDVNLAGVKKDQLQLILQLSMIGFPSNSLRKKLLILDVNGLLADIVSSIPKRYPDAIISKKAVFKRPFYDDFLQFCFERFCVGVWSSRAKKNLNSVLDFLMGDLKKNLLFVWDQFHCTNTGFCTVENREKPLFLKELKRLWGKHGLDLPWGKGQYNESNTLLLDDSPYKALRNPPYTAIFPHPYKYKDENDHSLGPGGDLRVYLERLASADNVQKYVEQNPFGQRPITERNLSWSFYLKIIGATSSQQEDEASNS